MKDLAYNRSKSGRNAHLRIIKGPSPPFPTCRKTGLSPDSESARKKLQRSGLGSMLGAQEHDFIAMFIYIYAVVLASLAVYYQ